MNFTYSLKCNREWRWCQKLNQLLFSVLRSVGEKEKLELKEIWMMSAAIANSSLKIWSMLLGLWKSNLPKKRKLIDKVLLTKQLRSSKHLVFQSLHLWRIKKNVQKSMIDSRKSLRCLIRRIKMLLIASVYFSTSRMLHVILKSLSPRKKMLPAQTSTKNVWLWSRSSHHHGISISKQWAGRIESTTGVLNMDAISQLKQMSLRMALR